jgi:hypothetical protein
MRNYERLENLGNIPVDTAVLSALYSDYASPSGKIEAMCRQDLLHRVRKGLYVVAPEISRKQITRELIANHLYGPSCISFETALEIHGMIPEAVYEVKSATVRRSKSYDTTLGRFSYLRVPEDYFRIGVGMEETGYGGYYLLASPEKALCDTLMLTRGLRIQSGKAMLSYLEEFLRLDMDILEGFDLDILRGCIETGRKAETLSKLLEVVRHG